MGYVYRYTDLDDGIIKYVGIVWADNRELYKRIYEHSINDWWCIGGNWKIEYVETPIDTRTDAEYMESHFIALFHTGNCENGYNVKKDGWGISSFIPCEWEWKEFIDTGIPKIKCELSVLNYKKVKVSDSYKIIQDNYIYDHVKYICQNAHGAQMRSFTSNIKIPDQLLKVFYKDGTNLDKIHLAKVKKRPNGDLKYIYKLTEIEAKEMFEYLCRCYGYKRLETDNGFEEHYDYVPI